VPRVFEVTTDTAWVDAIVAEASALDHAMRCNQGAVQAGAFGLTYPSAEQLAGYMAQGHDDVIVAHIGSMIDGYLVVRAAESGCVGKWVGVFRLAPTAEVAAIYRGLLDVAVQRYGWVRGRITNDELREWLRVTMPGTLDPDDPTVIRYGDVTARG
jgi:hypothetical protein